MDALAASREIEAVRAAIEARTALTVAIEASPAIMPVRGGQSMFHGGQLWCASSYGIVANGVGAYLTAGHCGYRQFTINGHLSTGGVGRAVGGYLDRQAVLAPGSSWIVRVTGPNDNPPNFDVDMEGPPGHVYEDTRSTSWSPRCLSSFEERYDATAEPFGWRFGRNDADKLSPASTPTPTTPPDRPDSTRPRSWSTSVGRWPSLDLTHYGLKRRLDQRRRERWTDLGDLEIRLIALECGAL